MPNLIFKLLIVLLFLSSLTIMLILPLQHEALAQSQSTEISNVYEITGTAVQEGDILISTAEAGLKPATSAYDNHLFGVLQNQPLMVSRRIDNKGKPVVRYGTAKVNVTTLAGNINPGDYITSSEIPGKGQKADQSGYVIGVALSAFTDKDGQQTNVTIPSTGKTATVSSGKISVALKIEFAEITSPRSMSRALDYFSIALFKNVQDPSKFVQILRYIIAAITVLVSFGIGFITFSRSIPKSIEAIGRNPLAEKAIIFSIVLNIIFTVLTALIGVVVAVFILRF